MGKKNKYNIIQYIHYSTVVLRAEIKACSSWSMSLVLVSCWMFLTRMCFPFLCFYGSIPCNKHCPQRLLLFCKQCRLVFSYIALCFDVPCSPFRSLHRKEPCGSSHSLLSPYLPTSHCPQMNPPR